MYDISKLVPGTRFGKLTYICCYEANPSSAHFANVWKYEFKCDCGNILLMTEEYVSILDNCGCDRYINVDMDNGVNANINNLWKFMCKFFPVIRPKQTKAVKNDYENNEMLYLGWRLVYKNFQDWCLANGYASDKVLDRKDRNKGFWPDNCIWIDKKNITYDTFYSVDPVLLREYKIVYEYCEHPGCEIKRLMDIHGHTVDTLARLLDTPRAKVRDWIDENNERAITPKSAWLLGKVFPEKDAKYWGLKQLMYDLFNERKTH